MLRRLETWCSRLSLTIEVRHGDTPLVAEAEAVQVPLPTSWSPPPRRSRLYSRARGCDRNLATVKAVVVDELHNLVESKRGVQLTVGLERLRKVAGDFQLVGLSATVGSPEETAGFIFGEAKHRIVRAAVPKEFGYRVEYPTPDSNDSEISRETFSTIDLAARLSEINEQIGVPQVDPHLREQQDAGGDARREAQQAEGRRRGAPRLSPAGGEGEGRERVQGRDSSRLSSVQARWSSGSTSVRSTWSCSTCPRGRSHRSSSGSGRSGHSLRRRSEGVRHNRLGRRHPRVGGLDRGGPEGQARGDAGPTELASTSWRTRSPGTSWTTTRSRRALLLARGQEGAPVQGPVGGGLPAGGRLSRPAPKAEGRGDEAREDEGDAGSTTSRTSLRFRTRRGTSSSTWRTTRPSGSSGWSSCSCRRRSGCTSS